MFATMRPFVILMNIVTLVWFVFLQYYRFKDTGRACSGGFLDENANVNSFYMVEEGQWIMIYTIAHLIVYIVLKIAAIIITNAITTRFDEERAKLNGLV